MLSRQNRCTHHKVGYSFGRVSLQYTRLWLILSGWRGTSDQSAPFGKMFRQSATPTLQRWNPQSTLWTRISGSLSRPLTENFPAGVVTESPEAIEPKTETTLWRILPINTVYFQWIKYTHTHNSWIYSDNNCYANLEEFLETCPVNIYTEEPSYCRNLFKLCTVKPIHFLTCVSGHFLVAD